MFSTIRTVNRFRVFQKFRFLSSCAQPSNDLGFKTSYNQEQTDKVLSVVNSASLLELKNYQISHQRIQRLIKRRDTKGNFECIEDLLEIDGFGVKILEKFCNSVINSKTSDSNLSKNDILIKDQSEMPKRQQYVTPAMLEVIRTKAQTVVSFHVDLNYFAWTKFYYDRDADEQLEEPKFYVDGWNCFEFAKQDKHLKLTDLIELMIKFNEHIPHADLYTLESLPPAIQAKQPGSALQVNVNIQKTQLIAMLCALMASRRSANKLLSATESEQNFSDQPKEIPYIDSVYFLKNFLPSRFYKILVGNERVAAANVINQIISYNYTVRNKFDPTMASINISENYREFWNKSSRIQKEYLGSSMLTGLTFLKLCIDRCSGSIEKLSSRGQKS